VVGGIGGVNDDPVFVELEVDVVVLNSSIVDVDIVDVEFVAGVVEKFKNS